MDTFVLVFTTPTALNWNFSLNFKFCQYPTHYWVYIRQTEDINVTLHAEFSRMISSLSLQGILVVKIRDGGQFRK